MNSFLLPPRQIIASIHQNPTNDEFHRLPSDWGGRATEKQAQSQRHESCEKLEESRTGAANAPQRGKTKWKTEKEETDYHLPSMNDNNVCSAEGSMFGLLMTCTDREGVGRCSSNTTCHISQPRQLHKSEIYSYNEILCLLVA